MCGAGGGRASALRRARRLDRRRLPPAPRERLDRRGLAQQRDALAARAALAPDADRRTAPPRGRPAFAPSARRATGSARAHRAPDAARGRLRAAADPRERVAGATPTRLGAPTTSASTLMTSAPGPESSRRSGAGERASEPARRRTRHHTEAHRRQQRRNRRERRQHEQDPEPEAAARELEAGRASGSGRRARAPRAREPRRRNRGSRRAAARSRRPRRPRHSRRARIGTTDRRGRRCRARAPRAGRGRSGKARALPERNRQRQGLGTRPPSRPGLAFRLAMQRRPSPLGRVTERGYRGGLSRQADEPFAGCVEARDEQLWWFDMNTYDCVRSMCSRSLGFDADAADAEDPRQAMSCRSTRSPRR